MDPMTDPRADEIAVLAGGLAHEIRNPLSTIGLNLDLLAESLGGDDEREDDDRPTARRRRMLRTVRRECGRLSEILDAFLGFARAGTPELKPADLNAVVREFADFFEPTAAEAGVTLRTLPAPGLPAVMLDPRLFRQVLMNLALNAVQALSDAGTPRPTLELTTRPILAGSAGGAVELTVADNGPGVPADARATMWDPFVSTKPGGSGLGLPTVRKVVEGHGGRIHCESGPAGTTFRVALPTAE